MTFSVVTPSFKQLDWLRLAIASVRDQVIADPLEGILNGEFLKGNANPKAKFENPNSATQPLAVEHIIQDAGSPGIEEFAREVGADFYLNGNLISHSSFCIPNYSLAIFSERDKGMYDAINRGFARSKGDILSWLNSDEQYLPGGLATVVSFLKNDPHCDAVAGDCILIDAAAKILSYRRTVMGGSLYIRMHHLSAPSCATFYRKNAVAAAEPINVSRRVIADAVWVSTLLARGVSYRTIPVPLAAFTFTGENLSDSAQAMAELDEWRSSAPFFYRIFSRPVQLLHWIRKFFAGAYASRPVDCWVFTLSSPGMRIRATRKKTPIGWPKPTRPAN